MKKEFKDQLIERVEKLRETESYDEIIELLVSYKETSEDYDLAMLLARAFLDFSEYPDDGIADTTEMLLSHFPQGLTDPLWRLLSGRCFFARDRFIEAHRELSAAEQLSKIKPLDSGMQEELDELMDICMSELVKLPRHYGEEEQIDVIKHIAEYFGRIQRILPEHRRFGPEIEIAEIAPDAERNYYTLVTIGLGCFKMHAPEEFDPTNISRAELVMYLPAEWDEEMRGWAYGYMRTIASLPVERNVWIGYGHIFSNSRPIHGDTELTAATLIQVQDVISDAALCRLPNGEGVIFYHLFPIYKEEMDYKLTHGINALVEKMPHISAVLDFHRENVCRDSKTGTSVLLGEEIDYVSGLGIGEYCAASRKILDNGERVGYMRRFLFDRNGYPGAHGDSGWLFMAGTETRQFLSDPYNIRLCRLNTVCNIDTDVIPFLTEPFNTVAARENGGDLTLIAHDPDTGSSGLPPS